MNKVVHAAQRAAFSAAIDVAINAVRGKGTEKLSENAVKLVNLAEPDRKSTRLNSSHKVQSRMPSSA